MELSIALIYDALYRMGFKADRTGFFYLSYSVYLCLLSPEAGMFSREWLYPKVGRHYRTQLPNIRQQVDRQISRAWRNGKKKMEEIAERPLEKCPNDMEIIRYLYQFMVKTYGL